MLWLWLLLFLTWGPRRALTLSSDGRIRADF